MSRDEHSADRAMAADTRAEAGNGGRPLPFDVLLTEVVVSGGPALLRIAASYTADFAEDILNTAVERALARPEAFAHGDPRRLYRWLETTVRNEALRTLRGMRREVAVEPELLEGTPSGFAPAEPAELSAQTAERIATLEALSELNPTDARCLALSARGFSRAEIAEMLSITPLTVKRRLARGRLAMTEFGEELASGRRCARLRASLVAFVDGDIDDLAERRLTRHLDHCGRCRGQLVALRRQRTRLSAALPPCLVLTVAERAPDSHHEAVAGGRVAEAIDDGWLSAWTGFWLRVMEGWHALTPVGRTVAAGASALLALAGIGTVAGEVPNHQPRPDQVAESTPPRTTTKKATLPDHPKRPTQKRAAAKVAKPKASPRPPVKTPAPARASRTVVAAAALPSPAPTAPRPSATTRAPSSGGARAEFEPGP